MREYRRLDDSVTMRMNRNGALFREASRSGYRSSSGPSTAGDETEACLYFWKQLVGAYCILIYLFSLSVFPCSQLEVKS